ncbi:MAG: thiamine pyrophosphate-binding protein [Paracoccus sp. (in: a-proteobacteria)]|nr:thiamine pyrophosphate-binding protein [Paracoccus sp. (in: a-proteobacteria)]
MADMKPRSAGRVLVDQLIIHGADTAYCVPGESYLEILDALYDQRDRFTLINARHEAGAANMAEAYGKLTGRPGICMVTRGPGACHAAIGVHVAMQDSTPMILLIGQVARDMRDREAFQEVDYRAMFGPLAKWVAEIDSPERVPEYLARAFRVATSGRPGPVVLSLPEDMLKETVRVADATPYTVSCAGLSPGDMEGLAELLRGADRPLLILGGSGWTEQASADILRFAEANGLPVTTSFRRQDCFDNRSDSHVGEFGTATGKRLLERLDQADLLVVLGARLGEMTTRGYDALKPPQIRQKLVHVHQDADEIGRVYGPDLGFSAHIATLAAALRPLDLDRREVWADWTRALRDEYLEDSARPKDQGFDLDMGQAFADLRDDLPRDMIMTLDAGNHTGWAQRFLRFGRPGRQLASTCGAMGYGIPAAVAAALREPERLVIAVVGDGGFLMSLAEIGTAAQHGAAPVILLFNNESYGTIRMHQERDYPGRVSGTRLKTHDFCEIARGLGAHAERVTKTADVAPALERARASGRVAVIELVTDAEQISTRSTISGLRAKP